MDISQTWFLRLLVAFLLMRTAAAPAGEDWPQFKFDTRHSGNVPERVIAAPLRLAGAVPLTDAILTAPVVADGQVYVVDGAGAMVSNGRIFYTGQGAGLQVSQVYGAEAAMFTSPWNP